MHEISKAVGSRQRVGGRHTRSAASFGAYTVVA